ncbi:hypothetical protein [Melghirimyces thermohalophilus]|uniref:hypothetical protein n=1 Tax=Melghirimyces thermohalophilus TaxID=1236220 RepID=UPI0015A4C61E|nr:hypothetical protein [Melghirimyces thermohalophilus]
MLKKAGVAAISLITPVGEFISRVTIHGAFGLHSERVQLGLSSRFVGVLGGTAQVVGRSYRKTADKTNTKTIDHNMVFFSIEQPPTQLFLNRPHFISLRARKPLASAMGFSRSQRYKLITFELRFPLLYTQRKPQIR